MEEDPSVFDYDGVYDEMKGKITRPKVQDRTERKIEEQHKKAMEEDPSVFDYDGVYNEMKGKIARPKIEEQHKKAMEEDPSVFEYNGVYDEMKGKITRPKVQDRTVRMKTSKPTPPRPPPHAFTFGDGDNEDDIKREISRQASKNKSLQKFEEQHKKAMEEDPSVFDYDRVYDEMKGKIAHPKVQD
ncbi:uncharacterized protein LOC135644284 [Musa acuminata AAA Group]|uniref:uncharacterized protein LOC135644284 n=1 Tax=Musa acuminata AAA Group TaxID=214697 RepID=UPI0031D0E1C2